MSDDDYQYSYSSDESDRSAEEEDAVRLIREEDVWSAMQERSSSLGELLGQPAEVALALLHLHRWSEERVCQAWLDPATPSSNASVMTEVRRCSGECAVCCGEEEELLRIEPCGHCFCRSCWRQYLGITGGEQQGHSSCAMPCMQDGCSVVLAEPLWRAAGQQELYRQLSVRWNISVGERMRCCPTPHCPWVLCLGPLLDRLPVGCRCGGGTWCSRCGREWHAPVSCADVERWEEKCASESETGSWLAVHTKPCPRCRTRIEKNQGCNHMRCTQCGYHFCWVCMESWDDHGPETGGYYHCNRFAERSGDGEADGGEQQSEIKTQLERYLHYYYRYQNHLRSRAHAKQQLATAEEEAGPSGGSRRRGTDDYSNPAAAVPAGLRQVCRCRTTLAYTYVMCFYSSDGPERVLLEDQQEQLEKFTERLTELLEQDTLQATAAEEAAERRQQQRVRDLQNLVAVAERFRLNVEETLPLAADRPPSATAPES